METVWFLVAVVCNPATDQCVRVPFDAGDVFQSRRECQEVVDRTYREMSLKARRNVELRCDVESRRVDR